MTGGSFITWSKTPRVRLLPSHRIWEIQKDGSQVLEKDIPGFKTSRNLEEDLHLKGAKNLQLKVF